MRALLLLPVLASVAQAQPSMPAGEAAFAGALRLLETGVLMQRAAEPLALEARPLTHEQALESVKAELAGALPEAFVDAAFAEPNVAFLQDVVDRFSPRLDGLAAESQAYEDYRRIFITPGRVAAGAEFYRQQAATLSAVGAAQGVAPLVLVSLIGVETHFGRFTGKYPVFNALYTILRGVPHRSRWAGRELAHYLRICRAENIGAQSVLGSYAGAFGYFQFMPSSYNAYAVDFDADGRRRWDAWPDALGSVSNYLVRHGYQPGPDEAPGSPLWRSLYAYNHSDNYVRVILELKAEIAKQLPPQP